MLRFYAFYFNKQFTLFFGGAFLVVYSVLGVNKHTVSRRMLILLCLYTISLFPVFLTFNFGLTPLFYYVSTLACFFSARKMALRPNAEILKSYTVSFYLLFSVFIFL